MTPGFENRIERDTTIDQKSKEDLKEEFKDMFSRQGPKQIKVILNELSQKYYPIFNSYNHITIQDLRLYIISNIADWIDEM